MNLCNRFFLFLLHVFYLLSPSPPPPPGIMIALAAVVADVIVAGVCGYVLLLLLLLLSSVCYALRLWPDVVLRRVVLVAVSPFVNTFHMQTGVGTKKLLSMSVFACLCV